MRPNFMEKIDDLSENSFDLIKQLDEEDDQSEYGES